MSASTAETTNAAPEAASPWQAQIIDQLTDADTDGATHAIVHLVGGQATLLDLTNTNTQAEIARLDYEAKPEHQDGDVETIRLDQLYDWHKQQLAKADTAPDTNDPELPADGSTTPDSQDTDADTQPGLDVPGIVEEITDEIAEGAETLPDPDPDTGKLFDVPRVTVLTDDTDPTLLKLAFSGSIEIERGDTEGVDLYNKLKAGKSVEVDLTAHVAGSRKVHRRDKEGDVDAIVETKSLIITDIHHA